MKGPDPTEDCQCLEYNKETGVCWIRVVRRSCNTMSTLLHSFDSFHNHSSIFSSSALYPRGAARWLDEAIFPHTEQHPQFSMLYLIMDLEIWRMICYEISDYYDHLQLVSLAVHMQSSLIVLKNIRHQWYCFLVARTTVASLSNNINLYYPAGWRKKFPQRKRFLLLWSTTPINYSLFCRSNYIQPHCMAHFWNLRRLVSSYHQRYFCGNVFSNHSRVWSSHSFLNLVTLYQLLKTVFHPRNTIQGTVFNCILENVKIQLWRKHCNKSVHKLWDTYFPNIKTTIVFLGERGGGWNSNFTRVIKMLHTLHN